MQSNSFGRGNFWIIDLDNPYALACKCSGHKPGFLWAASDTVAIVTPNKSRVLVCISAEIPGCSDKNPVFIVQKLLKGQLDGLTEKEGLRIQPEDPKTFVMCGGSFQLQKRYIAYLIRFKKGGYGWASDCYLDAPEVIEKNMDPQFAKYTAHGRDIIVAARLHLRRQGISIREQDRFDPPSIQKETDGSWRVTYELKKDGRLTAKGGQIFVTIRPGKIDQAEVRYGE